MSRDDEQRAQDVLEACAQLAELVELGEERFNAEVFLQRAADGCARSLASRQCDDRRVPSLGDWRSVGTGTAIEDPARPPPGATVGDRSKRVPEARGGAAQRRRTFSGMSSKTGVPARSASRCRATLATFATTVGACDRRPCSHVDRREVVVPCGENPRCRTRRDLDRARQREGRSSWWAFFHLASEVLD